MGKFRFVRTTKKHRAQKFLAMLVVAVAEKSQRNRLMLELFARQRYDRDKLQTNGLVTIFGRVNHARL